jgi:hypothetical protein
VWNLDVRTTGGNVDVPTLILLGAAGGTLRGLLDVYNRFLDWQSDRRAHRQLPAGEETEPPRFQEYFDPVADPVAAVLHSAMGAGTAVLFGTTGQISGAYAAIIVGISAPVILTQLGRVQSVSDAVTGASPTAVGAESTVGEASPQPAPLPQSPPSAGLGSRVSPPTRPSWPQTPPMSAPATVDDPGSDVLATNVQPDSGAGESNGGPAGPAGGSAHGIGSHGAPRLPHSPTISEEGTTR